MYVMRILILVLLLPILAIGRQGPDTLCQSVRNKPMTSMVSDIKDPEARKRKVEADIRILQHCGQMDSIDRMIWQGPTIGMFIVPMAGGEKALTYGAMLHVIDSVRATPFYQDVRRLVASKASSHGMDNENFVETKQETMPYKFRSFKTLDDCLANAREDNKKVLLYFTGKYSVNSRTMEKNVFTDERLKAKLSDQYDSYILYADDETPMEGKFKIVGDYILNLQQERFNADSQPYFVILDSSGKTLGVTAYTGKVEDFIKFLQ